MQALYKDLNKGADLVDVIIYIERISRYLEENILKDLENGSLKFAMVGEFLIKLKKEFSSGNDKTMKVAELKKG